MTDILVIGGGPAGLSAAINAAARGASCTVVSGDIKQNPLYRASVVDNYPGMRGVSGAKMLDKMQQEAEMAGTVFIRGKVLSAMDAGDSFFVTVGTEVLQAKRLIIATGAYTAIPLPGEAALIGKGVSYCATCDGMLYRGRRAIVTGNADDLPEEAAFLKGIGVDVTVVLRPSQKKLSAQLDPTLPLVTAEEIVIQGTDRVEGVLADGQALPCEAVFALRESISPEMLLPGLPVKDRFIEVDRAMQTGIKGIYAAGDCTGKPFQIAKAVGEGLIAAQAAAKSLKD